MKIKLGCIADDFTGATDLANNLVRSGMRVVQTIGVPTVPLAADVHAVVVALKSRTIPAAEAIAQSLQALKWLQAQGAQQLYFKYCSTFDSTPEGNIGPVTEALMDALGCDFTIATPAFPDNGRTVFKGYLFAGNVLLNESGMQNHPLTPMQDANLVRVMQAQTQRPVGLIDYKTVAQGEGAIRERIAALRAEAPADKQALITDLFEKITLYDIKTTQAVTKKRADGRFDLTLTILAQKLYADGQGKETKTPLSEVIDIGVFTVKPDNKAFNRKSILAFERRALHSGSQTLTFTLNAEPKFAGIDPYAKLIDRNTDDNVRPVDRVSK
jgi:hypothetical protein